MENDQTFVESDLAHLLDELAVDLHNIAESLRLHPFAAVAEEHFRVYKKIGMAHSAGLCLTVVDDQVEAVQAARKLIEQIRAE